MPVQDQLRGIVVQPSRLPAQARRLHHKLIPATDYRLPTTVYLPLTTYHTPLDFRGAVFLVDPPLLERVAVADRDGAVVQRLAVDRDAERRADLVLAAVAAADGRPSRRRRR